MNAAEHYVAAEQRLDQAESQAYAGDTDAAMLNAQFGLAHAILAIAAEAGVPSGGPHPAAQATP